MKYLQEDFIDATVEMRSLIGVQPQYPVAWGNYFWLPQNLRVLNFWSENFEEAVRRFLTDGKVRVLRHDVFCIIDDLRVPKDWYYNKLCFTGGKVPPRELAEEIYGYLGDPDNEFQQFTDPESYYTKRGWTYSERTGMIGRRFDSMAR